MKETPFDENQSFINLLQRSKNIGGGWRQVSDALWEFVKTQAAKQSGVFELDHENKRVRFSDYY